MRPMHGSGGVVSRAVSPEHLSPIANVPSRTRGVCLSFDILYLFANSENYETILQRPDAV